MKKKIRMSGKNNFNSLLWTGQNQERKRPNSWELLVLIDNCPTLLSCWDSKNYNTFAIFDKQEERFFSKQIYT